MDVAISQTRQSVSLNHNGEESPTENAFVSENRTKWRMSPIEQKSSYVEKRQTSASAPVCDYLNAFSSASNLIQGSGGYGSVYKGHWGNQPCAVKTFFLSQSELAQQSIQTEISFFQTLRHRHIIQFYRTHKDHGHTYLLMELAENGSLQQAILNTHPSLDDWTARRRLASEIAQGLAFIHQEGIIHRDLKSANVLLTRHMEAKLADFGLAKVKSMTLASMRISSHSRASLLGTLRWIAPELLFAKKPTYTAKSDVYALGVVMWEMAANSTRPFNDQDNDAFVALAVSQGERETFPVDTPAEYRVWAERCWHHDPIQRPHASEVVQIHDEPTKESTEENDDDVLDFSFDSSDLTGDLLGTQGDHQGASEAKATRHEKAGQHISRFPSTDDEMIYDHGHGVDKNDKDAFWWYRMAASHGTVAAQLRVGKMYEQGQGVPRSFGRAASWYLRAADGGSAEAQYQIACVYQYGPSDKRDEEEASMWFHMAAQQGHRHAQYELWQWNANAQYELGKAYWNGQGATKSDAEAVKWLTLAAEQGNSYSQFKLYSMYDKGQGVEQNTAEAVKWLTKMAEQGCLDSQFDLGFMFVEGRGVEQNHEEGFRWLTKAAEKYFLVEGVFNWLLPEKVQRIIKAVEQGVPAAQFYLGLRHEGWSGNEKSKIKPVEWQWLSGNVSHQDRNSKTSVGKSGLLGCRQDQ
ncbi:hypothetical protein DFQ26_001909 [Actinomortierella ambigua]|nr:hypothetical protein DFQ26_001909 [Actinomortierella ambigua]